ncbi:Centromere/kinetochore protein zw10, partial [Neolecta irregularis DAH-3]
KHDTCSSGNPRLTSHVSEQHVRSDTCSSGNPRLTSETAMAMALADALVAAIASPRTAFDLPDRLLEQDFNDKNTCNAASEALENAIRSTRDKIDRLIETNREIYDDFQQSVLHKYEEYSAIRSETEKLRLACQAHSVPFQFNPPITDQQLENEADAKAIAYTGHLFSLSVNEAIIEKLSTLQCIYHVCEDADTALLSSEFCRSLDLLQRAQLLLSPIQESKKLVVLSASIQDRIHSLKNVLFEKAESVWNTLVKVDSSPDRALILPGFESTVEDAARALETGGKLPKLVKSLYSRLNTLILRPLLSNPDSKMLTVEDSRYILRDNNDPSITIFDSLKIFASFIDSAIPRVASSHLIPLLLSTINSHLIREILPSYIPENLHDLPSANYTLQQVEKFEVYLENLHWTADDDLRSWVGRSGSVWVSKTKQKMLIQARQAMIKGSTGMKKIPYQQSKVLYQVESTNRHESDDWNADWDEKQTSEKQSTIAEDQLDEWGLDFGDDIDEEENIANEDEWSAWNEDDQHHTEEKKKSRNMHSRNLSTASIPDPQVELCTISSLPNSILELVRQVLNHFEELQKERYAESVISIPPVNILNIIPPLLTLYRALAPLTYAAENPMLACNDCMYLASNIRSMNPFEKSKVNFLKEANVLLFLATDWYNNELESLKSQVQKILSKAENFISCTVPTRQEDCESSVQGCIELIRSLTGEWNKVLSKSVTLKSLGFLVEEISSTMIQDIEMLKDISEPESKNLSSFIKKIGELEILFQTGDDSNGTAITAMYSPSWFKFQWLAEILEWTMSEIMSEYRDGNLVDFSNDELISLLRALFAESDLRRKNIEELRRS